MPVLAALSTAVPPHRIGQAEARAVAADVFGPHRPDTQRLLAVFDNAGVAHRSFCVPLDWFGQPHTFRQKNDLYIEWSTRLGTRVAEDCLRQAGLQARQVDQILFVSTTGLATPSIDARLLNVLGLPSGVLRTPLWGLGCAGGAAGLAHAYRAALAAPAACILLVIVELCGLTFDSEDHSKANLVATALFGDGAAGVLVAGDEAGLDGPKILAAGSTTWPDSLDVMGWSFDNAGMQVVFARAIPSIVRQRARHDVETFLQRGQLRLTDISHFAVHPGGQKVLAAYEAAFELPPEHLVHAREVLRDYGNMSSATVLFVLQRMLQGPWSAGEWVLLTALGPGFSAEKVLLHLGRQRALAGQTQRL